MINKYTSAVNLSRLKLEIPVSTGLVNWLTDIEFYKVKCKA